MEYKDPFITLADHLIESRDTTGLDQLRKISFSILMEEIDVKQLSLIELNEYIDEATAMLEDGKATSEIVNLPIRKLLE